MKNKIKQNTKGITLIALVITIIVLLILAGVVISMLSGENGILRKAVKAKEKTESANKQEEEVLLSTELRIEKSIGNDIGDYLEKNSYTILNDQFKTKDTSYITEGKYVVENNNTHKKYIIDNNLEIAEATELINVLLDTINYVNEEDIENDINGTVIQEMLAKKYNTNKYSFNVVNSRLLCYPSDDVSIETVKLCDRIGIYLWGDINNDFIVDDFDSDRLSEIMGTFIDENSVERIDIVSDLNR